MRICCAFYIYSFICYFSIHFLQPTVFSLPHYAFGSSDREEQFMSWLKSFRTKDPIHQELCEKILNLDLSSTSQFGQDLFLFQNIFRYWPMSGKRGFYVDSGANDAIEFSNTYFYDICLGWDGLCIEPEKKYHEKLRKQRSCSLVPECISKTRERVNMVHAGVSSSVNGADSAGDTQCDTFESILARYNRTTVDLWSLDVEGYELRVLRSVNFSAVDVRVALVEEIWSCTRELDRVFTDNGFYKYQQMAIDAVYVKRGFHASDRMWYPRTYEQDWRGNDEFRLKHLTGVKPCGSGR